MLCDIIGWTEEYVRTPEFKKQIKKWLKVGRRKYYPWTCECGCGGKIPILKSQIYNRTPFRICRHNGRDMRGETHGMLYVYDYGGVLLYGKNNEKKRYWKCLCECGELSETLGSSLTARDKISCGCQRFKKGEEHYTFEDLTGMVVGYLTVIKFDGYMYDKHTAWLCRCDSPYHEEPVFTRVPTPRLKGKTDRTTIRSCGCVMHKQGTDNPRFIDIAGEIYEHKHTTLKAIKYIKSNDYNQSIWEFECTSEFHDEPKLFETVADRIKSGRTKSCGCLREYVMTTYGNQPNFNPDACRVIDEYGEKYGYNFQHAENGGEVRILTYYVDAYDHDRNTILEVDESHHFREGDIRRKDIRRQRRIMRFKKCTFIRIRIDHNGNRIGKPDIYKPGELPELYPDNGVLQMVA